MKDGKNCDLNGISPAFSVARGQDAKGRPKISVRVRINPPAGMKVGAQFFQAVAMHGHHSLDDPPAPGLFADVWTSVGKSTVQACINRLEAHPGGRVHNEEAVHGLIGRGKQRMKKHGGRYGQKTYLTGDKIATPELEAVCIGDALNPTQKFYLLRRGVTISPRWKSAVYSIVVDAEGYLVQVIERSDDLREKMDELMGLTGEEGSSRDPLDTTEALSYEALLVMPALLRGTILPAENSDEEDCLVVHAMPGGRLPDGFEKIGQGKLSREAVGEFPPGHHWIFRGEANIKTALAEFSRREGGRDHTIASVNRLLGVGTDLVQGRPEQRRYPRGVSDDWGGEMESCLDSNWSDPEGVHGIISRYMIRAGEIYGDPRLAPIYYIETDQQGFLIRVLHRIRDDDEDGTRRASFNAKMKEAHARWRPNRPTLYYGNPARKREEPPGQKPRRVGNYGTNPRNPAQYARGERRRNAERVAAVRAQGLSYAPAEPNVGKLVKQVTSKLTVKPRPPSCPLCDAPMWLKESHRGKSKGEKFWGCSLYRQTKCEGSRPLE